MHAGLFSLKYIEAAKGAAQLAETIKTANAAFKLEFGQSISLLPQKARAGRPAIWLSISSDPQLLQKNGSANSMSGLHCAMLAAHVWVELYQNLKEKTT